MENHISQNYTFLEGKAFQVNNFTWMDSPSNLLFHWKLDGPTIHVEYKLCMDNPSKTA